jgi:hypothetical protein
VLYIKKKKLDTNPMTLDADKKRVFLAILCMVFTKDHLKADPIPGFAPEALILFVNLDCTDSWIASRPVDLGK